MGRVDVSVASDYAVMGAGDYSFYYGYEYPTPEDEWQFVVKHEGKIVLQVVPKLPKNIDRFQCDKVLMYCVAGFIARLSSDPNFLTDKTRLTEALYNEP